MGLSGTQVNGVIREHLIIKPPGLRLMPTILEGEEGRDSSCAGLNRRLQHLAQAASSDRKFSFDN
jgi:hypothetical protein